MFIYKITNTVNGKAYIGQTKRSIRKRFIEHSCLAKEGCRVLKRAFIKYGIDNFKFELILQSPNELELGLWEKYYIKRHNTLAPSGYNLTTGGEEYVRYSEETKRLMSQRRKEWFKNNKHPKGMKGKKHSAKTKRLMSAKRAGTKHPQYGHVKSSAERAKDRVAQACKSVYGLNSKTGQGIFLLSINAGKSLGFDPRHIGKCCKGRARSHLGFTWRYLK